MVTIDTTITIIRCRVSQYLWNESEYLVIKFYQIFMLEKEHHQLQDISEEEWMVGLEIQLVLSRKLVAPVQLTGHK